MLKKKIQQGRKDAEEDGGRQHSLLKLVPFLVAANTRGGLSP